MQIFRQNILTGGDFMFNNIGLTTGDLMALTMEEILEKADAKNKYSFLKT